MERRSKLVRDLRDESQLCAIWRKKCQPPTSYERKGERTGFENPAPHQTAHTDGSDVLDKLTIRRLETEVLDERAQDEQRAGTSVVVKDGNLCGPVSLDTRAVR